MGVALVDKLLDGRAAQASAHGVRAFGLALTGFLGAAFGDGLRHAGFSSVTYFMPERTRGTGVLDSMGYFFYKQYVLYVTCNNPTSQLLCLIKTGNGFGKLDNYRTGNPQRAASMTRGGGY